MLAPVTEIEKELEKLRENVRAIQGVPEKSLIWACYRMAKEMIDKYQHKPEDKRNLTIALMSLESAAKFDGKHRETAVASALMALEQVTTFGWYLP